MFTQLAKVARLFKTLRELDRYAPVRVVAVFVAVAVEEGVAITELARRLKLPLASTSRAISALSHRHWIKGKAGLGLVHTTRIGRTVRVDLTPKGRALAARLVAALGGSGGERRQINVVSQTIR